MHASYILDSIHNYLIVYTYCAVVSKSISSDVPTNTSLPSGEGLNLKSGSVTEYRTVTGVSASVAITIPTVELTAAFSWIVKSV